MAKMTLEQAVIRACGIQPDGERTPSMVLRGLLQSFHYSHPILNMIITAIITGKVVGKIVQNKQGLPVVDESVVEIFSLADYFEKLGFHDNFFNTLDKSVPPYLNPNHHRYAPKLGIAIKAWEEVSLNFKDNGGNTAKEQLVSWLVCHADDLGIVIKGNPHENQTIQDIAKVANWNIKGGAPEGSPGSHKKTKKRIEEAKATKIKTS